MTGFSPARFLMRFGTSAPPSSWLHRIWREAALSHCDPDFAALKNLAAGLRDLASVDLRKKTRTRLSAVRLQDIINDVSLIIGQDWVEIGGEFDWHISEDIPPSAG